MTINNILEKLNHKHRAEVEIDDGQFSLCGVAFFLLAAAICIFAASVIFCEVI